MTPSLLAEICNVLNDSVKPLPNQSQSLMERVLSYLFPPRGVQDLGLVGSESFEYHYRLSRIERDMTPLPGKYFYAARLGKVRVGQPAPVYERGTRESRMAQLCIQ
jgi:hypothetical protein